MLQGFPILFQLCARWIVIRHLEMLPTMSENLQSLNTRVGAMIQKPQSGIGSTNLAFLPWLVL